MKLKSQPKSTLALCIPAYMAENCLPSLLESARDQDPPFDEIIVCDDASTDNSASVARSFGARVTVNESNLGCSASKNRALELALSDWVHFHDADDLLLPGFTAEAHQWMSLEDAPDVVIMGFEYRDFTSNRLLAIGLVDDHELASDPIRYSIVNKLPNFGLYQSSTLRRVGGFDCDPETLYNEDVAFHTKLALSGLRFRASNQVTSINWLHANSMSQSNQVKCLLAHYAVMRNLARAVGLRYSGEIADRLWSVATGLAAHKEWQAVDQVISLARQLKSTSPRSVSRPFHILCNLLGPKLAYRLREYGIRTLKPQLRSMH